jgi:hypothetical protein
MEKERGMPVNGPASRPAIHGKTVEGAQPKPSTALTDGKTV